MSSERELDQFLADLGARRQRVLRLTEPSGHQPVDLVEELHELSEQLIVADEELRVQQEELEEARAALIALSAERDLLLQDSSKAYLVTDDRGVVTQWTRAARQFARQPFGRSTPRPLASSFEVSDRRAVRGLIGRVVATGDPQRADGLRMLTDDGHGLAVDLAVERVAGAEDGRALLRWELTAPVRPLSVVPSEGESERQAESTLAFGLAQSAMAFQLSPSREDLFDQFLDTVVRLVPGAQHAGLVLLGRRGATESAAATSGAARWADGVQLTERVGPLALALTASSPTRCDRLDELVRSASGPGFDHGLPSSALALPLLMGERRLGVLTVYADQPGVLDREAELTAAAASMHITVALRRLFESTEMEEAVRARQLVGQAVGILVERHGLTSEQAFSRMVTWSQHHNVKLRSLARTLAETGQEPPPLAPS